MHAKEINKALKDFLERKGFTREFSVLELWKKWEDVIGPEMAQMARPLKRQKNTLIIGVEDSIIMQELYFYSEEILKRIEDFLGWQPFDKIKYKLLEDKTPLTEKIPSLGEKVMEENTTIGYKLPSQVGTLTLSENGPVGRAYSAYVKFITKLGRRKE